MKLFKDTRFNFSLLILMLFLGFLINKNYDHILQKQIKQQKTEFNIAANEFEAKMNNSFIFVYGLSGFTHSQSKKDLTQEKFEEFAKNSQKNVPYIKNFSIAIDYVQSFVYPLKGNEATLGHDLIKDSRKRVVDDVKKAVETNRLVISGPYELRQGGLGMVIRNPISHKTINSKILVNVVIDVKSIIRNSEIYTSNTLSYQLSNNENVFWGKDFESNYETFINVGNDTWTISTHIPNSLNKSNLIDFLISTFSIVIFIISLLIILISIFKSNNKLYTKVHSLIYDDVLTGLPNRRAIEEKINDLIKNENEFCIAFLDLDNFKDINDTLGHSYGDKVLKIIADRFIDFNKLDFYRWGGDEFVLIGKINLDKFLIEIKKIQKIVSKPIELNKQNYVIKSSLGICSYPSDGQTKEELIRLADTTMYYAKSKAKNSYKIYDEEIDKTILEKMKIERLINKSLKNDLFEMNYQPLFSIKKDKIYGFEALIRMKDEKDNYISPQKFISIAEKSHLIQDIDKYVINKTLKHLNEWNQSGFNFLVSVNISANHFSSSFVNYIDKKINQYNINPEKLEIEITESLAIKDFEDAKKFLDELSNIGVKVALDDFGTGYSSLGYISKLYISTLKIDRTFINKIDYKNNEYYIIKSVIEIIKALEIKSVAEGVENEQQLKIIKDLNCDAYQGYYLSKPVPKEKVIDLL